MKYLVSGMVCFFLFDISISEVLSVSSVGGLLLMGEVVLRLFFSVVEL